MARSSEAELRRGEAATWGARSGPTALRPKMRFVSWKPIAKGSLHGFARVELPIGLKLIDCAVFVGTKGAWASPPAKPQLDQDGSQRNGVDGKPSYSPVVEWRSRDLADRFSTAVVALVRAAHPNVFSGEIAS
jgi:hypothetical protein